MRTPAPFARLLAIFALSALSAVLPTRAHAAAETPPTLVPLRAVEPALAPEPVTLGRSMQARRHSRQPPQRRFTLAPFTPVQALAAAHAGTHGDDPQQIGFQREVASLRSSTDTLAALAWERQADGRHLASISVASPEAAGLRLGLRIFSLPPTALLRTHAPGADTTIETLGSEVLERIEHNLAAGDHTEAAHTWWSPIVESAEAAIEIELPAGVAPSEVQLALPQISHLTAASDTTWNLPMASSLSCHNDVTCHPDWDPISRATALLIYTKGGNSYVCSGTLLNDKDPSSFIPYLLSAHHCLSTQTVASTLEAYWFYRTSSCNSGSLDPARRTTRGGATLLYASADTDTAFMRLNAAPPAGAMYAGWHTGLPASGSAIAGVHHPGGDLQKISFGAVSGYGACSVTGDTLFRCESASAATANHIQTRWTSGTIEPGSSGSGLFDGNKYLVGNLHGGSLQAACTGNYAYYGRFDLAYTRGLHRYLDGAQSGNATLTVERTGAGSGKVSGTGIDCGADCAEAYRLGTTVTLTATPDAGSTFDGWSGACTGTVPRCSISLSASQSVSARFGKPQQMALRDAIYLYNQPIYSNAAKMLTGYNCDVFQIILDVKSGYTDLGMYETALSPYPDRIDEHGAMFAYSLYSTETVKAFTLWDNTAGVPDAQIGSATFFGYCFSTHPDAAVLMYDDSNGTCRFPDGSVVECSESEYALPRPSRGGRRSAGGKASPPPAWLLQGDAPGRVPTSATPGRN